MTLQEFTLSSEDKQVMDSILKDGKSIISSTKKTILNFKNVLEQLCTSKGITLDSKLIDDLLTQIGDIKNKAPEKRNLQMEQAVADFEDSFELYTAIVQVRSEYLKKRIEKEKENFNADPSNKEKTFDESSVQLSYSEEAAFMILHESALANQVKKYEDFCNYIVQKKKECEEQKLAITKEFSEKEKASQTDEEKKAVEEQKNEELKKIDTELKKNEEVFKNWIDNVITIELNNLLIALKEVESEMISGLMEGIDPEAIKEVQQLIKSLETHITGLKSQGGKESGKSEEKTGKKWEDVQKAVAGTNTELKNVGKYTKDAIKSSLESAAEMSTSILSIINHIKAFGEAGSKSITGVASTAVKAIQVAERASMILAAISLALNIFKQISEAFSFSDKDKIESLKTLISLQDTYNNKLIESILTKNKFDKEGNKMGGVLNVVDALKKASENYTQILNRVQKVKTTVISPWFFPSFLLSDTGDKLKENFGIIVKQPISVRENLEYITKKGSKGVLGIGSKAKKTENLEEWVRKNLTDGNGVPAELFSEDGRLNLEIATSLVEKSSDRLTGDTEESLKALIEAEKIIQEAEKALKEYLKNTFGSLGEKMGESLITAFKNGTNAAEEFKKNIVGVLEEIGEQMIRNLYFQKIMDEYSQTLEDAYKKERTGGEEENAKDLQNEIIAATKTFFDDYTKQTENAEKFLKTFQEEAAKSGFELYTPTPEKETRQGISGEGLARASQDSISELSGRMLAANMYLSEQKTLVDEINKNVQLIASSTGGSKKGELIQNIETNTLSLVQLSQSMLYSLQEIKLDTVRLKAIQEGIDTMNLQGIKIKSL